MHSLEPLMRQNFLEYASYVIVDRAIPDIRDGCKPVQRRILHTLFVSDDGKFNKVANIIGEAMKLHPHGDVSIGDALVVLANKEYFIEKQGNFGNVLTGHQAAASRYIECRLTPLAKETLFNRRLTTWSPSYDGRRDEPVYLPAKLPVVLLLGTEGIAVGMATKILPHNLIEALAAQIALLEGKKAKLLPDFIHGGSMDVSEYADGAGKVKVRAKMRVVGDKKIVIDQIPYGTTTESLIASIEQAIQKGKVKIANINDFTTDKVEIELTVGRGAEVDETVLQLYAYTDCEVSIASNVVVIRDRHPQQVTISEVLSYLTEQLRNQLGAELEQLLTELKQRAHWLVLEALFIEHKIYRTLERAETAERLTQVIVEGLKPHLHALREKLTDEDVSRLLEVRIRRISAFDRNKNQADIDQVDKDIGQAQRRLKNLTKTTIEYLQDLIKRYGKQYPRRTKITRFEAIDRKAVARQNIKLSYDAESGFFGSDVRGGDKTMTVSEYDLVLGVSEQGTFRVMAAPNKVLLGKVLYLEPFDAAAGAHFVVVYRDGKKHVFAKRIHINKFVRNKEYRLFADTAGKIEVLSTEVRPGKITVSFVPGARQKMREERFDLNALELTGVSAKGTKVHAKPVHRVRLGS